MIKPTVGRVVWFYEFGATQIEACEQPQAAIVAHVHGDRCVNLAIYDRNGCPILKPPTSVRLLQDDDRADQGPTACWMPYQVGQAKRHEAGS